MAIESTRITSETLQAAIRQLLPSQVGFGDDLHATNLIQPVIDLTQTAEGSSLALDLSRALSFGSSAAFSISNATTDLTTNTGFLRVIGTSSIIKGNSDASTSFQITDGVSNQTIWSFDLTGGSSDKNWGAVSFDFVAFVRVGETLQGVSNNSSHHISGSVRQIATVTGTLVNPVGFTAE